MGNQNNKLLTRGKRRVPEKVLNTLIGIFEYYARSLLIQLKNLPGNQKYLLCWQTLSQCKSWIRFPSLDKAE